MDSQYSSRAKLLGARCREFKEANPNLYCIPTLCAPDIRAHLIMAPTQAQAEGAHQRVRDQAREKLWDRMHKREAHRLGRLNIQPELYNTLLAHGAITTDPEPYREIRKYYMYGVPVFMSQSAMDSITSQENQGLIGLITKRIVNWWSN